MPTVACDYALVWPAHNTCQYQHRRRVAVPAGELCQTGSIAIKNRSRRDTVDESLPVEAFVRKRAEERWRPRGNYLRTARRGAHVRFEKSQQALVPGMRCRFPFALTQPAILAVIVVQATELQLCLSNSTHEPDNFVSVALFDSCAIHAGVYVEKDADRTTLPLPHLFFALGQDGNADVREMICYFAHAACVCAHCRIG